MATVHKIEVFGNDITVYAKEGETIDVYGVPMVRLRHGTIVKPDGFTTSLADAKRAAAARIETFREQLAERAAQLRQEADAWTG